MKKAIFTLVGISPISFSKKVNSEPNKGELPDAFEERTWREKMHEENGRVFIPPNALKNAISGAAKYFSEKIPGKGNSTYTKNFEAGIGCFDPIILNDGKGNIFDSSKVSANKLFVPSDGVRGSGKRVWKYFPVIPTPWQGKAIIYITDPMLIEDTEKVKEYVEKAGQVVGLLFFRPQKNGYYGRYIIENWEVSEII